MKARRNEVDMPWMILNLKKTCNISVCGFHQLDYQEIKRRSGPANASNGRTDGWVYIQAVPAVDCTRTEAYGSIPFSSNVGWYPSGRRDTRRVPNRWYFSTRLPLIITAARRKRHAMLEGIIQEQATSGTIDSDLLLFQCFQKQNWWQWEAKQKRVSKAGPIGMQSLYTKTTKLSPECKIASLFYWSSKTTKVLPLGYRMKPQIRAGRGNLAILFLWPP